MFKAQISLGLTSATLLSPLTSEKYFILYEFSLTKSPEHPLLTLSLITALGTEAQRSRISGPRGTGGFNGQVEIRGYNSKCLSLSFVPWLSTASS